MDEKPTKNESGLAKAKKAVVDALDQNQNGMLDIEDVIIGSMRLPGICIDRESFLRKQLKAHCTEDVVEKAIAETPLRAKVPLETLDKIADAVIQFERNCVSGISAAISMPGGVAMVATIPADILQYYGYLLRASQKLLYLYGFPQIDASETAGEFDDATMNTMILCLGIMYGTAGASNALKSVSRAIGVGLEKKLLKRALTKGTMYPMIKNTAKWFGVNITKKVFAEFFKKAIPVAGGVLGGAITYLTFKPCCDKLKKELQESIFEDPLCDSSYGFIMEYPAYEID